MLPQDIANIPAYCQNYLASLLKLISNKEGVILYMHMGDLIVGHQDTRWQQVLLQQVFDLLHKNGFKTAANKVQEVPPFKILGAELTLSWASLVQPKLDIPTCLTLTQIQSILGD